MVYVLSAIWFHTNFYPVGICEYIAACWILLFLRLGFFVLIQQSALVHWGICFQELSVQALYNIHFYFGRFRTRSYIGLSLSWASLAEIKPRPKAIGEEGVYYVFQVKVQHQEKPEWEKWSLPTCSFHGSLLLIFIMHRTTSPGMAPLAVRNACPYQSLLRERKKK